VPIRVGGDRRLHEPLQWEDDVAQQTIVGGSGLLGGFTAGESAAAAVPGEADAVPEVDSGVSGNGHDGAVVTNCVGRSR
jgi:hypothetical protein